MADNQAPNKTFQASGDINPSRFVTVSGNFTVAQSAGGDTPIGVAQLATKGFNATLAAASGDSVGVYGEGEECWLYIEDTITAGNKLKPNSSGNGVAASSTNVYGAVALEGGTTGTLIRVSVQVGIA